MNGKWKTMTSSKNIEWTTPKDIFTKLDAEFNFTLDPCCTAENALCKKFYTIKENGLLQSWKGETVFLNPPYGNGIRQWIRKAFIESISNTTVVCLIPARTDTSYWHDYCMKGEIRFLRGRLKFGGCKNPAPFASALVIFRGIK